jgi:molybdate transport system regulatory protein
VWLEKKGELIFGEGKSELLKAIDQTGSINRASLKLGISFRQAWSHITAIERRMGFKIIERTKGGRSGGGSRLTPLGRDLIRRFDCLNDAVNNFTDHKFEEILGVKARYNKNR